MQDARLDIHAHGFWKPQGSAFFDFRVCHPNAESYRVLKLQQIYCLHEKEKKCQYSSRVPNIEHGTFTPVIFTTTGGLGREFLNYHSRLAQLFAIKKGEDYAKTITSFALLIILSALICLTGTRTTVRKSWDFCYSDIETENTEGAVY